MNHVDDVPETRAQIFITGSMHFGAHIDASCCSMGPCSSRVAGGTGSEAGQRHLCVC